VEGEAGIDGRAVGPNAREAYERTDRGSVPTIIVMVDEFAGDGDGRPFVHGLARWLYREFIDPFVADGRRSPFAVALILADASLANDEVLANYQLNDVEATEGLDIAIGRCEILSSSSRTSASRRPPDAGLHVMADG
jgi:hypothetical protein